ncbi:MAG: hypothetical protein C4547_06240 [Phycisphaerales bacterium]|nr:MAG: hypothetical protein C4547_06240 [Phycisphaerales bacterium]
MLFVWCIAALAGAAVANVGGGVIIDPDGDGLPGVAGGVPSDLTIDPAPGVSAEDMAGGAWAGTAYAFDSSTGVGRVLGPSGTQTLNASAPTGDGEIYMAGRGGTLWIIDPSTGLARAAAGITLADVRGLALSPSGKVFAVNEIAFGQPDELHAIDPQSGNSVRIGSMGLPGVQGLAFCGDTLYAYDIGPGNGIGQGLVTVDVNNAQTTDVDPNQNSSPQIGIQTISCGPDGKLYGGRSEMYRIDTVTADEELVGSGGYSDVRGWDFLEAGGPVCRYTIKKSRAKRGCETCPPKGSSYRTEGQCEDVKDCNKKLKTTIACPDGNGICKLKGKAESCS